MRLASYSFTGLPAGDYEVFEVVPSGWEVSPGFDNKQTAAVVALQQTTVGFRQLQHREWLAARYDLA